MLKTLRKILGGFAVDTGVQHLGWKIRQLTFLVQSRLMKGFGFQVTGFQATSFQIATMDQLCRHSPPLIFYLSK